MRKVFVSLIVVAVVVLGACDPAEEEVRAGGTSTTADAGTAAAAERSTTTSPAAGGSTVTPGGVGTRTTEAPLGYSGTAPTTERPRTPVSTATTKPAVSAAGSDVPDAEERVEYAKLDLVRRKGYEKDEIRLVLIERVTWSDAALGCPQYERQYDQTDVPGYRIELQWQDVTYHYHGKDGEDPFLCQKLDT